MAPEEAYNLVAVSVQEENGNLKHSGQRLFAKDQFLRVSWYTGSGEIPYQYHPILDGVAFVYEPSLGNSTEFSNFTISKVDDCYYWRDTAGQDGFMFILILPDTKTIVEFKPVPEEVKIFQNRLALYWLFYASKDTSSQRVTIEWKIQQIERELSAEVERITRIINLSKHRDMNTEYDIALSFAGEDREYVEEVARLLKQAGVRVFYDDYEKVSLWGTNLYDHLNDVYNKLSRYAVMFISQNYAKKLWTNHERKAAQARAFVQNREYILPVRFDDTEVPGLLPTVGYLSVQNTTPVQLVELILQKLQ